jgi:hypothetical protein
VKIPINALKEFASKFGLNRVIVFASEPDNKTHHVATYGRTITECSEAADFGNKLKEGLGWPEALQAQPSRVVELQKKLADLQAENDRLRKGIDEIGELIDESKGVAGLHLNGNVAEWGWLLNNKWLETINDLLGGK